MSTAMAPTPVGATPEAMEPSPGTLPDDLREPVAAYLAGAQAILVAPGTMSDPLDPDGTAEIPIAILTDGAWIWDSSWPVLVRAHAVAPPAEFLSHMAANGYTPAQLDVAELMAVGVRAGLVAPAG